MSPPDVTILIPHYQTLDAIRLCLRSIRRYTAPPYRVLVLDNGSRDASREYLRSVAWIDCLDTGVANGLGAAQAAALNIGVAQVDTPYFVAMHSDTYVHRPGWLSVLLARLRGGGYAAVGARHQSIHISDSALIATVADRSAELLAWIARREVRAGVTRLRSCLVLYGSADFHAAGCRFATNGHEDPTHAATAALVAGGKRVLALPEQALGYYVFHKGDTTRIANKLYADDDREFHARIARHLRQLAGFRARAATQAILRDGSLDL